MTQSTQLSTIASWGMHRYGLLPCLGPKASSYSCMRRSLCRLSLQPLSLALQLLGFHLREEHSSV